MPAATKTSRKKKKTGIFIQNIDRRYRKNLETYLKEHFRYGTMRTWDGPTSYANDIRLKNLNIPDDKMDIAMQLAKNELECPSWDEFVIAAAQDFYQKTGYHIGFNGNACGYLVLYACEDDASNPGQYKVLLNKAIDPIETFDPAALDLKTLKARADLVWELDTVCEQLRNEFVRILQLYEVHEKPVGKKKTIRVFEPAAATDC